MNDRSIELLVGGFALSGLALASILWLRATRSLRRGGPAERLLDGALVLCWLAVVFFFLLAGLGLFHVWTAIGIMVLTGLLASALAPRRGLRNQVLPDFALRKPELADPYLWVTFPVCAVALGRLTKSMVAPPMAWDAMTMHLPKAAFWIQSGSLALPDFPDAWTYYRWFPAGGEILFAWIMLPFRADLLLGPFGLAVWLAMWIAAARLARGLGAPNQNAWLVGGAIAALPAAMVFMTANYVDNLAALFSLLAVGHTVAFVQNAEPRNGILGLAAAGLAISVKTSSILLAAPLVVAISAVAWRHRARLSGAVPPAFLAALSLPCVGYLWTWSHTGSPLYPIKTPGLPLPYHHALAELFSGEAFAPAVLTGPGWPGFLALFRSTSDGLQMNFGLGGAILAAAAAIGLLLSLRRAELRLPLLLCFAGAALVTPLVLSPGSLALRTVWIGVVGRHLLPAYAPIAVCAALLPGWGGRLALSVSLLAASLHLLPTGWSDSMTEPALYLAGVVSVSALAFLALRGFVGKFLPARARLGLTALVAILFLFAWSTIRDRARYPSYRETAPALGAFDAHPLHPAFATAASLWPMLDDPQAKRIAVTVGPDKVGHNQFFYPLLGSRLQNRLIYVPTSNDPKELGLSARDRYARAQPEVWLANLEKASVDLVVGLWQLTPERDWLVEEGSFEVTALTDLGVPWIGRRRDEGESSDLEAVDRGSLGAVLSESAQ